MVLTIYGTAYARDHSDADHGGALLQWICPINCIDGFCSNELHHNARFCSARGAAHSFPVETKESFSTCHFNPVRLVHTPIIANIPTAHRSTDHNGTPPFARTAETTPPFLSGRQGVGLFIVPPACTCGATASLLPVLRRVASRHLWWPPPVKAGLKPLHAKPSFPAWC